MISRSVFVFFVLFWSVKPEGTRASENITELQNAPYSNDIKSIIETTSTPFTFEDIMRNAYRSKRKIEKPWYLEAVPRTKRPRVTFGDEELKTNKNTKNQPTTDATDYVRLFEEIEQHLAEHSKGDNEYTAIDSQDDFVKSFLRAHKLQAETSEDADDPAKILIVVDPAEQDSPITTKKYPNLVKDDAIKNAEPTKDLVDTEIREPALMRDENVNTKIIRTKLVNSNVTNDVPESKIDDENENSVTDNEVVHTIWTVNTYKNSKQPMVVEYDNVKDDVRNDIKDTTVDNIDVKHTTIPAKQFAPIYKRKKTHKTTKVPWKRIHNTFKNAKVGHTMIPLKHFIEIERITPETRHFTHGNIAHTTLPIKEFDAVNTKPKIPETTRKFEKVDDVTTEKDLNKTKNNHRQDQHKTSTARIVKYYTKKSYAEEQSIENTTLPVSAGVSKKITFKSKAEENYFTDVKQNKIMNDDEKPQTVMASDDLTTKSAVERVNFKSKGEIEMPVDNTPAKILIVYDSDTTPKYANTDVNKQEGVTPKYFEPVTAIFRSKGKEMNAFIDQTITESTSFTQERNETGYKKIAPVQYFIPNDTLITVSPDTDDEKISTKRYSEKAYTKAGSPVNTTPKTHTENSHDKSNEDTTQANILIVIDPERTVTHTGTKAKPTVSQLQVNESVTIIKENTSSVQTTTPKVIVELVPIKSKWEQMPMSGKYATKLLPKSNTNMHQLMDAKVFRTQPPRKWNVGVKPIKKLFQIKPAKNKLYELKTIAPLDLTTEYVNDLVQTTKAKPVLTTKKHFEKLFDYINKEFKEYNDDVDADEDATVKTTTYEPIETINDDIEMPRKHTELKDLFSTKNRMQLGPDDYKDMFVEETIPPDVILTIPKTVYDKPFLINEKPSSNKHIAKDNSETLNAFEDTNKTSDHIREDFQNNILGETVAPDKAKKWFQYEQSQNEPITHYNMRKQKIEDVVPKTKQITPEYFALSTQKSALRKGTAAYDDDREDFFDESILPDAILSVPKSNDYADATTKGYAALIKSINRASEVLPSPDTQLKEVTARHWQVDRIEDKKITGFTSKNHSSNPDLNNGVAKEHHGIKPNTAISEPQYRGKLKTTKEQAEKEVETDFEKRRSEEESGDHTKLSVHGEIELFIEESENKTNFTTTETPKETTEDENMDFRIVLPNVELFLVTPMKNPTSSTLQPRQKDSYLNTTSTEKTKIYKERPVTKSPNHPGMILIDFDKKKKKLEFGKKSNNEDEVKPLTPRLRADVKTDDQPTSRPLQINKDVTPKSGKHKHKKAKTSKKQEKKGDLKNEKHHHKHTHKKHDKLLVKDIKKKKDKTKHVKTKPGKSKAENNKDKVIIKDKNAIVKDNKAQKDEEMRRESELGGTKVDDTKVLRNKPETNDTEEDDDEDSIEIEDEILVQDNAQEHKTKQSEFSDKEADKTKLYNNKSDKHTVKNHDDEYEEDESAEDVQDSSEEINNEKSYDRPDKHKGKQHNESPIVKPVESPFLGRQGEETGESEEYDDVVSKSRYKNFYSSFRRPYPINYPIKQTLKQLADVRKNKKNKKVSYGFHTRPPYPTQYPIYFAKTKSTTRDPYQIRKSYRKKIADPKKQSNVKVDKNKLKTTTKHPNQIKKDYLNKLAKGKTKTKQGNVKPLKSDSKNIKTSTSIHKKIAAKAKEAHSMKYNTTKSKTTSNQAHKKIEPNITKAVYPKKEPLSKTPIKKPLLNKKEDTMTSQMNIIQDEKKSHQQHTVAPKPKTEIDKPLKKLSPKYKIVIEPSTSTHKTTKASKPTTTGIKMSEKTSPPSVTKSTPYLTILIEKHFDDTTSTDAATRVLPLSKAQELPSVKSLEDFRKENAGNLTDKDADTEIDDIRVIPATKINVNAQLQKPSEKSRTDHDKTTPFGTFETQLSKAEIASDLYVTDIFSTNLSKTTSTLTPIRLITTSDNKILPVNEVIEDLLPVTNDDISSRKNVELVAENVQPNVTKIDHHKQVSVDKKPSKATSHSAFMETTTDLLKHVTTESNIMSANQIIDNLMPTEMLNTRTNEKEIIVTKIFNETSDTTITTEIIHTNASSELYNQNKHFAYTQVTELARKSLEMSTVRNKIQNQTLTKDLNLTENVLKKSEVLQLDLGTDKPLLNTINHVKDDKQDEVLTISQTIFPVTVDLFKNEEKMNELFETDSEVTVTKIPSYVNLDQEHGVSTTAKQIADFSKDGFTKAAQNNTDIIPITLKTEIKLDDLQLTTEPKLNTAEAQVTTVKEQDTYSTASNSTEGYSEKISRKKEDRNKLLVTEVKYEALPTNLYSPTPANKMKSEIDMLEARILNKIWSVLKPSTTTLFPKLEKRSTTIRQPAETSTSSNVTALKVQTTVMTSNSKGAIHENVFIDKDPKSSVPIVDKYTERSNVILDVNNEISFEAVQPSTKSKSIVNNVLNNYLNKNVTNDELLAKYAQKLGPNFSILVDTILDVLTNNTLIMNELKLDKSIHGWNPDKVRANLNRVIGAAISKTSLSSINRTCSNIKSYIEEIEKNDKVNERGKALGDGFSKNIFATFGTIMQNDTRASSPSIAVPPELYLSNPEDDTDDNFENDQIFTDRDIYDFEVKKHFVETLLNIILNKSVFVEDIDNNQSIWKNTLLDKTSPEFANVVNVVLNKFLDKSLQKNGDLTVEPINPTTETVSYGKNDFKSTFEKATDKIINDQTEAALIIGIKAPKDDTYNMKSIFENIDAKDEIQTTKLLTNKRVVPSDDMYQNKAMVIKEMFSRTSPALYNVAFYSQTQPTEVKTSKKAEKVVNVDLDEKVSTPRDKFYETPVDEVLYNVYDISMKSGYKAPEIVKTTNSAFSYDDYKTPKEPTENKYSIFTKDSRNYDDYKPTKIVPTASKYESPAKESGYTYDNEENYIGQDMSVDKDILKSLASFDANATKQGIDKYNREEVLLEEKQTSLTKKKDKAVQTSLYKEKKTKAPMNDAARLEEIIRANIELLNAPLDVLSTTNNVFTVPTKESYFYPTKKSLRTSTFAIKSESTRKEDLIVQPLVTENETDYKYLLNIKVRNDTRSKPRLEMDRIDDVKTTIDEISYLMPITSKTTTKTDEHKSITIANEKPAILNKVYIPPSRLFYTEHVPLRTDISNKTFVKTTMDSTIYVPSSLLTKAYNLSSDDLTQEAKLNNRQDVNAKNTIQRHKETTENPDKAKKLKEIDALTSALEAFLRKTYGIGGKVFYKPKTGGLEQSDLTTSASKVKHTTDENKFVTYKDFINKASTSKEDFDFVTQTFYKATPIVTTDLIKPTKSIKKSVFDQEISSNYPNVDEIHASKTTTAKNLYETVIKFNRMQPTTFTKYFAKTSPFEPMMSRTKKYNTAPVRTTVLPATEFTDTFTNSDTAFILNSDTDASFTSDTDATITSETADIITNDTDTIITSDTDATLISDADATITSETAATLTTGTANSLISKDVPSVTVTEAPFTSDIDARTNDIDARLTSDTYATVTSDTDATLTSDSDAIITNDIDGIITNDTDATLTSDTDATLTSETGATLTTGTATTSTSKDVTTSVKPTNIASRSTTYKATTESTTLFISLLDSTLTNEPRTTATAEDEREVEATSVSSTTSTESDDDDLEEDDDDSNNDEDDDDDDDEDFKTEFPGSTDGSRIEGKTMQYIDEKGFQFKPKNKYRTLHDWFLDEIARLNASNVTTNVKESSDELPPNIKKMLAANFVPTKDLELNSTKPNYNTSYQNVIGTTEGAYQLLVNQTFINDSLTDVTYMKKTLFSNATIEDIRILIDKIFQKKILGDTKIPTNNSDVNVTRQDVENLLNNLLSNATTEKYSNRFIPYEELVNEAVYKETPDELADIFDELDKIPPPSFKTKVKTTKNIPEPVTPITNNTTTLPVTKEDTSQSVIRVNKTIEQAILNDTFSKEILPKTKQISAKAALIVMKLIKTLLRQRYSKMVAENELKRRKAAYKQQITKPNTKHENCTNEKSVAMKKVYSNPHKQKTHKKFLLPMPTEAVQKSSKAKMLPNGDLLSKFSPLFEPFETKDRKDKKRLLVETCGLENSNNQRSFGTAKVETYPWLGVLLYPKGTNRLVTRVVLVSIKIVLGSALDIDKLPKKDFREQAKVVLGTNCTGPRIDVLNYNHHPEFRAGFSNALVIVQIDSSQYYHKLRPLCSPPKMLSEDAEVYAMVVSDDCRDSKLKMYELDFVPLELCKSYYDLPELSLAGAWPRQALCARARRDGQCVWRAGASLLVVKQDFRWFLLGFGVTGPGCEAPSRYIDYRKYADWVAGSVARIGQPAVTRLAPNQLVLRRSVNQIQRFGPCDRGEVSIEIFADTTDVSPPLGSGSGTQEGCVQYDLTISNTVDYHCVLFHAYNVADRRLSPPRIELRPNCRYPPAFCLSLASYLPIDFYVTIYFNEPIKYKVLAYGKELNLTDDRNHTQESKDSMQQPIRDATILSPPQRWYKGRKSLQTYKKKILHRILNRLSDKVDSKIKDRIRLKEFKSQFNDSVKVNT